MSECMNSSRPKILDVDALGMIVAQKHLAPGLRRRQQLLFFPNSKASLSNTFSFPMFKTHAVAKFTQNRLAKLFQVDCNHLQNPRWHCKHLAKDWQPAATERNLKAESWLHDAKLNPLNLCRSSCMAVLRRGGVGSLGSSFSWSGKFLIVSLGDDKWKSNILTVQDTAKQSWRNLPARTLNFQGFLEMIKWGRFWMCDICHYIPAESSRYPRRITVCPHLVSLF